jgi:cold shock CspA family protein
MDEMESMAIFAESSGLVDGADLHRGDRVRVTVRQEPSRLIAVEIQKIR